MLKHVVIGFILAAVNVVAFAYPETFEKAAKIIRFFDEQPNIVWDGFDFNDSPTIIHNGTPELMAFHFKPDNPNWVPVPDLAYFGWFSVVDDNNLHHIKFHPHYPLNHTFVYVYGFVQDDSNQDRAYQAFVHEKFHSFQIKHFNTAQMYGTVYEDHLNEMIQQLLFLENKALIALLHDLSSVEKMKNVIAVYEMRRPMMKPSSRIWEDMQIRLEGIAEYVHTSTFLALPLLDEDPITLLSHYAERNFGWWEENPINLVDSAIKWRNYPAGAISGLALDTLNIDWKNAVQEGASPLDVLSEHLNMSDDDIRLHFNRVHQQWFDPSQAAKITYDIREYEDVLSAIRQKYQQTPGVEIQWQLHGCPKGSLMDNSYYLADGGLVSLSISMRAPCIVNGHDYQIEMNRHPVVFTDPSSGVERFKVNTPIIINGRYLDAQTPDAGVLHRLHINSASLKLDYTGEACFEWDGHRLVVANLIDRAC